MTNTFTFNLNYLPQASSPNTIKTGDKPQNMNLEEKELLDTVGEKINRHSHNGKQYEGVPELKIPFLGMYPKE